MKKKKHVRHPFLLFLFIFVVFVIVAYIFLPEETSERPYMADVKKEFESVGKLYNGKVTKTRDMDIWWVAPDGANIINKKNPGIELYTFNCEEDVASLSAFTKVTELLTPNIDTIMAGYGFTRNQKNSSVSIPNDLFYDYIQAYEKGLTKCVFVANPDCGTSSKLPMHYAFSFGCTNDFEKNYQVQAPYINDLGITNSVIYSQKQVEDFMKFDINDRRSGYYTIAKLENGKWTALYSGQDLPPCSVTEKYQIPKELFGDCWKDN